jgi:hypothetical protein
MATLIVICGLSFAGKSTLANAITARLGYEEIDVDTVGATLYDLDINDERLKELDWDRVYAEADRIIESRLSPALRSSTPHETSPRRSVNRRIRWRNDPALTSSPSSSTRRRRWRGTDEW